MGQRWGGLARWLVFASMLAFISGCRSELYHGLDERSANEMVVLLSDHGIDADKGVDSRDDERWTVNVPSGVKVEAWRVLDAWGLPREDESGFAKYYPREGLISTANEDRILLQYATAQELRATLVLVDGVVDAQVNLVLPEKARLKLSREAPPKPRASVLIKYRSADGAVPIDASEVRRVVSGGVEGLQTEDIEVLLTPLSPPVRAFGEVTVAQVGPISVASGSKVALQAFVGVLVLLVVSLSASLVILITRRRG